MTNKTIKEIEIATAKFDILDCVPVGLCLLRQDFVVLFWNRCLEGWTKIPRTEIVGTNICNRFSQLNQSKYQLRFKQVFEGGFPAIFSPQLHQPIIPAPLPNGQKRIQQTTINAVPAFDGVGFYALVVIQDITDLTNLLEKRKLTEAELKQSNTELEQFAYIASHDLQEPLRMVTSFTKLLEQRYSGQLDADADQIINFAVDGATRMQVLIEDLLTYSRVGTRGKAFEPTDCEAVFETALSNLGLLVKENSASVKKSPLPTVIADGRQLVQLFQNLIGNAIKYRSEQPPEIYVGAEYQASRWLFWVWDNGIGIDPKHAEKIFRVFQRLHSRQQYPGTGIGLAICQKIVERHGGHIWVKSEPGNGSTFYFTIPNREYS